MEKKIEEQLSEELNTKEGLHKLAVVMSGVLRENRRDSEIKAMMWRSLPIDCRLFLDKEKFSQDLAK